MTQTGATQPGEGGLPDGHNRVQLLLFLGAVRVPITKPYSIG
jgi:hypothetical protein